MLLEGKSVVVMGAGSGVGRASALRFAEEGAKVVVADVDSTGRRRRCSLIEAAGGTAVADRVRRVAGGRRRGDHRARGRRHFGRLDIIFNNVGVPTPRPGLIFEEHTVDDFDRLFAINAKGVFLGSKHAIMQFKKQGDGGVILNTGSVAGLVSWGGSVYGSTKGAVHQLTKAAAIEGAPFGIRCNAICPAGMPLHQLHQRRWAWRLPEDKREQMAAGRRLHAPARSADHRRGLRRGRGVPGVRPRQERHRRAPARRRRVRRPMTAADDPDPRPRGAAAAVRPAQQLQRVLGWRLHRRPVSGVARAARAGARARGRRPRAHRLPGRLRSSRGCRTPTVRTSRRSASRRATPPSATATCSRRRAADERIDTERAGRVQQHPAMGGTQHRRYRALVQPSFVPAKAQWWINNWIEQHRAPAHRQLRRRRARRAQRRLRRRHPGAHHHRELRRARRAGADHPRVPHERLACEVVEILEPIVAARRVAAGRRPHQRAGRGRVHRRGRRRRTASPTPRSTRSRCCCSRRAPARRGSRWASPSPRSSSAPRCSPRCSDDRALVRPAIEESLRWMPTDPMFSRHVTRDAEFFGVHIPQGSVLHLCLGAANRDPARWDRPDEYDITRATEAGARVRQRSARVPRHARRPGGDERRHHRAARPAARTCGSTPTPSPRATSASTNAAPPRSPWCSTDGAAK